MAQEEIKKRPVGRPRKEEPTKHMNFRVEVDLLEWLIANKGDKQSVNQLINNIIRKEAGL